MKIRFCAALLLAALTIFLVTGCAAAQSLNPMEDTLWNRPHAVEDTVESPMEAVITSASVPAETTALLSKDEAVAIALKDAGLEKAQVTRLRTELDYERGRPEYEVDFHHGGYEYDYGIDAATGKIISFDKDRED